MAKRKPKAIAASGSRKSRRIAKELPDSDENLQPSLAQHLPIEILSEVFLYNIPSSYPPFEKISTLQYWRAFYSQVFPMNLTRTCRSWRHAALNNPSLWSTWFMEMHNLPKKALSMLKCFLERFISRSYGFRLRFHIRLTGRFDSVEACKSIGPLLGHQDRWEEAECHFEEQPGDVAESSLDFSKLSLLQELRIKGSHWSCIGVDPGILEPNVPLSENASKLSFLRSVEVIDIKCVTYVSIISTALNLTELIFNVRDEVSVPIRIFVPTLRKLVVQNAHLRIGADEIEISLLSILECTALEELHMDNLPHIPFDHIYAFALRCDLPNTLLSLRFQFADGYQPSRLNETSSLTIISVLHSLRSLAIHGELSSFTVVLLSVADVDPDVLCPLLEQLTLEKITSEDIYYTALVTARWNAQHRCIKQFSFLDCKVTSKSSPGLSRGLTIIPGVDTCVQEGLKLDTRLNDLTA